MGKGNDHVCGRNRTMADDIVIRNKTRLSVNGRRWRREHLITCIFWALGSGWTKLLLTVTRRQKRARRKEGKLVASHVLNGALIKQRIKAIGSEGETCFGTCDCEGADEGGGGGRKRERETQKEHAREEQQVGQEERE